MEHTPHGARLTGQQLLVLQLLARGYSRAQIAALLGTSAEDVAREERLAGRILEATTSAAAVALARGRSLIL